MLKVCKKLRLYQDFNLIFIKLFSVFFSVKENK